MPKKKKNGIWVRGKSDYVLWVVTLLLLALGLIMVLSASTPASLTETKGKSSYEYLKTQAGAAVLGFGGMMFLSVFNINWLKKLSPFIYVALTILMFYTGIEGVAAGGARRWLSIKGLPTFQPSELAKFGYVIVFAHYLSTVRRNNSIKKLTWGALYPMLLLALK